LFQEHEILLPVVPVYLHLSFQAIYSDSSGQSNSGSNEGKIIKK
jgi:hypothetical protein